MAAKAPGTHGILTEKRPFLSRQQIPKTAIREMTKRGSRNSA
jgi:hypothetical protein